MIKEYKRPPKVSLRQHMACGSSDKPGHLLSLARNYGNFIEINSLPKSFLITDPDALEHILKKNCNNYSKNFLEYRRVRQLLGKGLLTTMGEEWLHKRRAIQSLLNVQMLEKLVDFTILHTDEMLSRWDWFAKYSQPLNVVPDMLSLVLRISMQFLFSEKMDLSSALHFVNHFTQAQRSMLKPLSIRFYWKRKKIEEAAKKLLQKRRKQHEQQTDLLSLLIEMNLPEQAVIDEMITFMATGHETTGNALCWILYSLSKHSAVTEQVRSEIKRAITGPIRQDQISQLTYGLQVIKEVLRLYPTIWNFARRAEENDEVCGYLIPKGSHMVISPFVLHRLPGFWEKPDLFLPERFSTENHVRYSYIPFGMGPHICIAHTFSFLKLQIIMTMIMQRFKFELLPESENMPFEPLISLRPAKPMRFRIAHC